MQLTLSESAKKVINDYQNLVISGKEINCPYYNNKKVKMRGALAVLVGKGSPEDIVEETTLFAKKKNFDISKASAEDITKFMKDLNLGIDCSGFAFHVLNAELGGRLKKKIVVPTKSIMRKLLSRMRKVENTNVKTLRNEINSRAVELSEVLPGDIICMIGTGKNNDLDHVLVVTDVEMDERENRKSIGYMHSLDWKTDLDEDGGIKKGTIKIDDANEALEHQKWEESGKTEATEEENATFWRAISAKELSVRRVLA